jgi:hypothetical protein
LQRIVHPVREICHADGQNQLQNLFLGEVLAQGFQVLVANGR